MHAAATAGLFVYLQQAEIDGDTTVLEITMQYST